jgi:hypothetical protein
MVSAIFGVSLLFLTEIIKIVGWREFSRVLLVNGRSFLTGTHDVSMFFTGTLLESKESFGVRQRRTLVTHSN